MLAVVLQFGDVLLLFVAVGLDVLNQLLIDILPFLRCIGFGGLCLCLRTPALPTPCKKRAASSTYEQAEDGDDGVK